LTAASIAARTVPPLPRLGPRASYLLAASVIGLALLASVTPSPLYALYAARWHFGPVTLTLIYATYAFGVLAALLLAGRVSDHVGRRPVLLVSLAGLALSTIVYMTAQSPAWLFAARGLQGLATGAALGAASAALLEFHARRDPAAVGLANGVASAGGIALGLLLSSSLVQLGDAPRVLPYVLLLVLFLAALAGAALMPEPVEERRPFRLTFERPRVPASVRGPFLLAALAVLSSWSIGGLLFSLGRELGVRLFQTSNVLLASTGVVVLAASAAAAQVLFGRAAPWLGASAGSVALAAGVGVIVAAIATGSGALYLGGAVVGGIGFGIAFLGGLRTLVAAIPAHERSAVLSAFYVVAYASLSIPAVLAGIAVAHIPVTTTFEAFGGVVAALALVVAAAAWRTRPRLTP
jgi:predicted MFS family arabinose efflux permease